MSRSTGEANPANAGGGSAAEKRRDAGDTRPAAPVSPIQQLISSFSGKASIVRVVERADVRQISLILSANWAGQELAAILALLGCCDWLRGQRNALAE